MANGILKGLAVAAGTAIGMTTRRTGRARLSASRAFPERASDRAAPDHGVEPASDDWQDDFLDIEPLLDRLERMEARLESIGREPSESDSYAAKLADLERRLEENTRELALLREQLDDAERRANQSEASIQRSIDEVRLEIPAMVERHVSARVEDLQSRFSAEIEQSQRRTLEIFERAIDEKLSSRIGAIERVLAEQAGSIEALNVRSTQTDNNLQRLVLAIEKLCERAQFAPIPAENPYEPQAPFKSQLDDAMGREPVVPRLRTEEPVVEMKVPAKKSRFSVS